MPDFGAYHLTIVCDMHDDLPSTSSFVNVPEFRQTIRHVNRRLALALALRIGWETYGARRGKQKKWRCLECCRHQAKVAHEKATAAQGGGVP